MRILMAGLLIGLLNLSCKKITDGITIVGKNSFGKEVVEIIETAEFDEKMLKMIDDTSVVALNTLENTQLISDWELETLVIGTGLETRFKFFHWVSLQTSGRIKLVFSRNQDPLLPSGH